MLFLYFSGYVKKRRAFVWNDRGRVGCSEISDIDRKNPPWTNGDCSIVCTIHTVYVSEHHSAETTNICRRDAEAFQFEPLTTVRSRWRLFWPSFGGLQWWVAYTSSLLINRSIADRHLKFRKRIRQKKNAVQTWRQRRQIRDLAKVTVLVEKQKKHERRRAREQCQFF